MTKIEKAIGVIQLIAEKAAAPAVMLSFGKDSMVLASLIREAFPGGGLNGAHFPRAHGFPLPVIYYREPWFPFKHEFADGVARSWAMEVHDYPPAIVGVKTKEDQIELVSRYNFGDNFMDIPKNTSPPIPRRDYICGLFDWLMRPKTALFPYPWDAVFIGHKSSDVDPFEGPVPLKYDVANVAGVLTAFPLRDWTDADVWDYIETNNVLYDRGRYQNRSEIKGEGTWLNPDYVHACTACIDPRNKEAEVFCPKLKRNVANHGHEVLQMHTQPDYIDK